MRRATSAMSVGHILVSHVMTQVSVGCHAYIGDTNRPHIHW